MVAKSVKWALASLVIALPPAAFAVGLGDVRLLSSLNAPLDAEIELVGATPEEMAVIKAQLASRELFARNGLDLPAGVGNITITPQTKPDGKAVLRMRSTQAVTDPFLTLLVEVDALRTHTVREYTLLLDPPVFAPGEQQNAPVAAPSTGAGTREGAIARQPAPAAAEPRRPAEPASSASAPASRPAPSPSSASSAAEGGTRTVRPGDTLSGIASEVANEPSQSRAWMLAIYQNNASAFDGNMNVLRSGAVLRIPNASAVSAIVPSEARAEIRRQYASWRGGAAPAPSDSEPGRLRLVAPGAPGGASPSNAQADAALQGRVRELEAQLTESRRLLEARNAELAQLQARLSSNQPAAAPTPPPAAQPTPPAPVVQPPAETAPPPAAEATPPPAAEQPPAAQETPPAAQEAQPAPQVVKRPTPAVTEESGGSIFDTLKEYWWALAGLIVVILALFGVKAIRSRKQNDFDDSLSRLQGAAAGADSLDRDSTGDTQPLRAQTSRESAFVVEESGTHERPRFSGGNDFTPATAPRNVASSDETISSDTAINLDQGDPLAEADFHMAYGLYDQAADLVRIAISREPGRRDLKLKLLEVFFVWGNKDQFLQTAHELAETRERAAPGEWEKIVIMGKQLAPEDPLFAGLGGGSGGALGGMDLDLEGGQDRVDFDILGEPVAVGSDAGIDLDIGSAFGESSDGSGATVTDANLALHEDGFTPDDAGTGITREMTQNLRGGGDNSPTVQQYGADLEAPTVEQPGLYGGGGNNPTIRQKVESAMKQGGVAAEQTAELAIDDLGLDLGALEDSPNLNATQEAPTLVAGLDERSRRIMDEAERRGGTRDVDATAIASTGAWNLHGEDLEHTMASGGEASETSRLAALKVGDNDLDFNFNDEEPVAPASGAARYTNGSGASHHDIDLDVGAATVPDTAFTATQKLSSEDLALPDLEPVTMSEVGTKLDLARAYMDMGDPEGARNILEEVMTEGSLAQKQEAQRLLESLPG
ncbi:MAG: FimV/HubP family polar landmark protein [Gammaproteobacteria bacterium]